MIRTIQICWKFGQKKTIDFLLVMGIPSWWTFLLYVDHNRHTRMLLGSQLCQTYISYFQTPLAVHIDFNISNVHAKRPVELKLGSSTFLQSMDHSYAIRLYSEYQLLRVFWDPNTADWCPREYCQYYFHTCLRSQNTPIQSKNEIKLHVTILNIQ